MPYADRARRLEYLKDWRAKNPTYDNEHRARTVERHRELLRADYRKHKKKRKSSQHVRYLLNREKVIAAVKEYRRRNPEMAKRLDILRASRMEGVEGTFTKENLTRILKEQEGVCFYCRQPAEKYEIDHKIPIKRGGTNWPSNLCYACFQCNRTKHTMTDAEFVAFLALEKTG